MEEAAGAGQLASSYCLDARITPKQTLTIPQGFKFGRTFTIQVVRLSTKICVCKFCREKDMTKS